MKTTFLSLFIFAFVLALFLPACSKKDDPKKDSNKVTKKDTDKVTKKDPDKEKAKPKRDPNEISFTGADTAMPYAWNENGKPKGIAIDITKEIFQKRLGLKLAIKLYPWPRAQENVKQGIMDSTMTAYMPFRKEWSVATEESLFNYEFVPFTKKNHPKMEQLKKIQKLVDTKAFKHGNYLGNGWANKNLKDKGYEVDWTPGMELSLKKLVNGRFDLLIDHPLIIRSTAKQLGVLDQLEQLPAKYFVLPFPVLISKKSKYVKLIPKIDEAIKAMKKDGTLKKLHEKY